MTKVHIIRNETRVPMIQVSQLKQGLPSSLKGVAPDVDTSFSIGDVYISTSNSRSGSNKPALTIFVVLEVEGSSDKAMGDLLDLVDKMVEGRIVECVRAAVKTHVGTYDSDGKPPDSVEVYVTR